MRPHVQFVEVDGSDVAINVYDPAGTGDRDVVVLFSGTMPMGAIGDDPVTARLIDGLRGLGRVITFDRRGVGQSDRPSGDGIGRLACWADDLEAVIVATAATAPVVIGHNASGAAALLVASRTDLVGSLVLCEPIIPQVARSDFSIRVFEGVQLAIDAGTDVVDIVCPGRIGDPGFRQWWVDAGHKGAGPAAALRLTAPLTPAELDLVERAFDDLRAPSLILRRMYTIDAADREFIERSDHEIGVTERRVLSGADWLMLHGSGIDDVVAAICEFVTGTPSAPATTRSLRAVLFTDLGASTETLQRLGDRRWRMLIDRHDEAVGRAISRRGGTLVKSMGDGILATFDAASSAIAAALDIRSVLAEDGLAVRAGVHVGDVEHRGADVTGITVNIAARIMDSSPPGAVVATAAAHQASLGGGFSYDELEPVELRGVAGDWQRVEVSHRSPAVTPPGA
jgi:class 3 adenylate cyclase